MLTDTQRTVLAALRRAVDRGGPLTTTEVASWYLPRLSRPKVAAAMKALTEAGFVSRAGVGDRNAPTFTVTDQGRDTLAQEV